MAGKNDNLLTLTNVRLSFPKIWTPKPFQEGGVPKFQAHSLIKKDDPQLAGVKAMLAKVKKEKWGDEEIDFEASQLCLRDGDKGKAKGWGGYAGHMYVAASEVRRPQIVNIDRTPLVESDGKPYGGCYVNVVVQIWAQVYNGTPRINAGLKVIQFLRDGEAFGAAPLDLDGLLGGIDNGNAFGSLDSTDNFLG